MTSPQQACISMTLKKLISVLNGLVAKGNTVVVIEHNLDVIKSADHIIDLGPEGGHAGGEIIATGTPEEIAMVLESYTGRFLAPRLLAKVNSYLESGAQPVEAVFEEEEEFEIDFEDLEEDPDEDLEEEQEEFEDGADEVFEGQVL